MTFTEGGRLVFNWFLDLHRNLGMLKKQTRKLVSPVRRSTWLHASTLQNFARQHFFDANEVSVAFSREIDAKTGESIWKGLITKAS